jgi:MFS family permease
LPKRELYFVLSALMLGMLLAALDATIVSTALPTIVGDLHGANHLSWVVVAYLLASTVSTPLWGKLGDLHGRKVYFISAIVIFLAGSMLCGFAQNMLELILFRAIQGLGGGGLMVGAQASLPTWSPLANGAAIRDSSAPSSARPRCSDRCWEGSSSSTGRGAGSSS